MYGFKDKGLTYGGNGFGWPQSNNGLTGTIFDVFGPQPLPFHLFTVGYSYDFHRGIDVQMDQNDPQYACMNGLVHRQKYTHFWWSRDEQLARFVETDTSGSATFSINNNALEIVCSRTGNQTFPVGTARIEPRGFESNVPVSSADWTIEMKISGTMTVTGSVGVGMWYEAANEYVTIGYDGETITCRGRDSTGAMTQDGTTSGVLGPVYLSLYYDDGTDRVSWRYSNDGTSWTNVATETGHSFTSGSVPLWKPFIYWHSTDSDAAEHTVRLEQVNWYDEDDNIGIFGNWVVIQNEDRKFIQIHFDHLIVEQGEYVTAGDLIGYAGYSGFNTRTGRNLGSHAHLEYAPSGTYFYDNDEQINPLEPGILPRDTSEDNLIVSSTFMDDPSGSGSFRVLVEVERGHQGFVLNELVFTGSNGTRLVNFNTRAGLNDDNDIPVASGVYIEPYDFSATASSYRCAFYFQTASVGQTYDSFTVRSTAATLVASGTDELSGNDTTFTSQNDFDNTWMLEKEAAISSSLIEGGDLNFQVNAGGAGASNSFWFDNNTGAFVWIPVTGSFDARTRVRIRNTANTGNPPVTGFRICGLAVHDMDRTDLNYIHIGGGSTAQANNTVEWKTNDDENTADTSAFSSTPFPAGDDLDIDLRIIRRRSDLQIFDLAWRPTTGSVSLTNDSDSAWNHLITVDRTDNTVPDRNLFGASADLAISMPEAVGVGFILYSNQTNHDIRGFFEQFSLRRSFA